MSMTNKMINIYIKYIRKHNYSKHVDPKRLKLIVIYCDN